MPIVTVNTSSNAPLTTIARVKSFLGITSTAEDSFLTDLIAIATNTIQNYVGRTFSLETITENLPGTGTAKLVLSKYPIVSITSITDETGLIDASGYEISDKMAGTVYRKDGIFFFKGQVTGLLGFNNEKEAANNITAVYQAGYSSVPLDVEMAAISYVRSMYLGRSRDNTVSSESVSGVYSVTYGSNALSADVVSTLGRYMNYAV
jgi:hypothetical protein